jgi:hypothetical protein
MYAIRRGEPWTGDINLHVEKQILSSSSLLEILAPPLVRSKKPRRSAIDASLKSLAWPGHLSQVRMLEYGAVFQKMSVARSSVALHETALDLWITVSLKRYPLLL